MKIKLLRPCLDNPKDTIGIVFNVEGNIIQAIFPNGEYDGFNTDTDVGYWYEIIDNSPLNYNFTNVIQLSHDFKKGVFKWRFNNTRDGNEDS